MMRNRGRRLRVGMESWGFRLILRSMRPGEVACGGLVHLNQDGGLRRSGQEDLMIAVHVRSMARARDWFAEVQ